VSGLLDSALIPTTKSIVDLFGITVVFTVIDAGTFNPETGQYDGRTETEHTVVCTPPGNYRRYLSERSADGGLSIERGDIQIGLPAQGLTFEPKTTQTVVVAGKTWQVVEVLPIYSGELPALYILNLRGGK